MGFVYELGVLGLSVAGTVVLARLAHAGRLPRLVGNDGMLASLIGAFTVGLCFGLIGIVFKLGPILGSPLIVGAITLGACVAVGWFLVLACRPHRRHGA